MNIGFCAFTHRSTRRITGMLLAPSVLLAAPAALYAQEPAASAAPGIVSHVKVLSDNVEDVSSMQAWKKSFIKDGMTEEQKALAIWTTVVKFRHQHNPPNEYIEDSAHAHDPIKDFNVYGYNQCCCSSAAVEAFARQIGMETRGWGINNHSVPEVKINGKWALLDGSLINYFKLPDGKIAGVMDIVDSVTKWLDENPEKKKWESHDPYYAIMRKGEWKRIGPEVLKGSPWFDDNGWQPAKTHAWGDTILEYGATSVPKGRTPFVTEYGVALGYQVNVQLRPGEKLIRNWSNKGLNINDDNPKSSKYIMTVNPQDPKEDLKYSPKFGDLTEGRVGNGTLEYTPPLHTLSRSALVFDNLTLSDNSLRPADANKPATLVIRMPSSYVYLSGKLDYGALAYDGGGKVKVSISDNNGLDWKPVSILTAGAGGTGTTADLKADVYRRYDYRLKFEISGGAAISRLSLTHDVQHSQRLLPALDKGENKISFSAGPQEGTITVFGNLTRNGSDPATQKNLLFSAFKPTLQNVEPARFRVAKGTGTVKIPVETPGDITRIRMGAFYRATAPEDKWTVEASFDAGKTFAPVATLEGPNKGHSEYISFDKVPANARSAVIRLTGNAADDDSLWMQSLRIDADYMEPRGGFMPVTVTYAYEENGEAKTNVHVARSADETYTIRCESRPKMKSITLEVAQ